MRFVLAVCFALICIPAFAQRELKDIPDPDPELERKSFHLADGFEVNLYASDPRIAKPIQMNFDPQGRLWIASSEVYPHIAPGQKANDKVLVLDDKDGDGVADTTTVFADGLLIPTGVLPGDGGVYVANSTDLLYLRDTDGDGKSDVRRIVLSGFGTEDTHHILHTLRWGREGFLYMNQSIYIHSHIETPYGVKRLGGGGIWRFRPDNLKLDVYMRGLVNPWGHQLDNFGQSFATDGAGGEGINDVVPGAYYFTAVGAARIIHGLNPGSPKYCGLEIIGGRNLPDDWQGNLITNDFRGHRVCRFVLSEEGSGFVSRQQKNLIETDHAAFRPIDVQMGPDGAIYIADWYNPIIQHGEVDFRDPRRDHTHGRIWRVTCKSRPVVPRLNLVGTSTAELLDQLKSSEPWAQRNASQVLRERGKKDVLPALGPWIAAIEADDPQVDQYRLAALWIYQALDVVEPGLLAQLLESKDSRVRAAATRVVGYWRDRLRQPLELLSARVTDPHPRVRLEAVRVLGGFPERRAAELALQALDLETDVNLDYALWLTARELSPIWLPLVQRGEMDFEGNVRRQIFALKSLGTPESVGPLVRLLRERKIAQDQSAAVLDVVASLGGPADLKLVFETAVGKDLQNVAALDPALKRALWTSLAEAARKRGTRPEGDLAALASVLQTGDAELQRRAALCAGLWKVESLRGELVSLAEGESKDILTRRAAMQGLVALGGDESRKLLEGLAAGKHARPTQVSALAALATLDLKVATGPALVLLQQSQDVDGENGPDELFTAFVQRKEGPAALAAVLAGQTIPEDVAKRGLRIVSGSGKEYPDLTAALTTAGKITAGPKELTADEMKSLVAEVAGQGNAARGEAVFRRANLLCLKCHAIGGVGGLVGPDLVSIGASAPVDYLIDSLLQPNKKVKENYNTLVVQTEEGRIYTGIKVRQTDADLILRDAEDREVAVPLKSIEEKADGVSIMPAGLTERLTRKELADLVRFLSELGKPGPYSVGNPRLVRRWRILDPTDAAATKIRATSYATAAADDPTCTWSPVYSSVSGELPVHSLPGLRATYQQAPGERNTVFVQCELKATTAGECLLRINSADGLQLWMGKTPVAVSSETKLPMTVGVHRLTFAIELAKRKGVLRVEVADSPATTANVLPVAGK